MKASPELLSGRVSFVDVELSLELISAAGSKTAQKRWMRSEPRGTLMISKFRPGMRVTARAMVGEMLAFSSVRGSLVLMARSLS